MPQTVCLRVCVFDVLDQCTMCTIVVGVCACAWCAVDVASCVCMRVVWCGAASWVMACAGKTHVVGGEGQLVLPILCDWRVVHPCMAFITAGVRGMLVFPSLVFSLARCAAGRMLQLHVVSVLYSLRLVHVVLCQ